MEFTTHYIGSLEGLGSLQEVRVDSIETGVMNNEETMRFALHLLRTADDLIYKGGQAAASHVLVEAIEAVESYYELANK